MPRIDQLKAAVFDTHAWVWTAAGDPRSEALNQYRGLAYIPAISVWEVAMLVAKGRLELKPDVETWVRENLQAPAVLEPLHPNAAILSTQLVDFHGDPADRLIVATAMDCGLPLITADERIIRWAERIKDLQVIPLN